jgi:hypothetical protein
MPQKEKTITEILDTNEFELPIGYTDSDGTLHKTVKLKEMTGEVDEAIADSRVRTNPGKIISETLMGIIESLGTKKKFTKQDILGLSTADRDFLMVMNHKVSIGDEIEYSDVCISCDKNFEVKVNVDDLEVSYMDKDESRLLDIELPNGIKNAEGKVFKKLKVGFPDGRTQELIAPLAQENKAKAETMMLANIVEDVEGLSHFNFETFQKLGKKDRKFITKELGKLEVGVNLAPKTVCPSCGTEQRTIIPMLTLLGE